jgi:hypothetical protein
VQIEGMASRTVEHDAGPLLGGIVPKTEKLLQLPDGGYGADTRFGRGRTGPHIGIINAGCFIFTYEGLEFQTDERVEQNNTTIAFAVCRGSRLPVRISGE